MEIELFYSKHRNSDEFREEQAEKQLKREHPVNHINSDMIDVNEMVKKIDAGDAKQHLKYFCSLIIENVLQ